MKKLFWISHDEAVRYAVAEYFSWWVIRFIGMDT